VTVRAHGPSDEQLLLQLDREATGLDRSATLRSLLMARMCGKETKTAVAYDRANDRVLGAGAARLDGDCLVVGPLLGAERAALPLIRALLQEHEARDGAADSVSVVISEHPSLVERLTTAGFAVSFELGAMTRGGAVLPGNRESYLALVHPTLG
jgi:hypothetical protein